jgi:AcrR family transcriptional regulator
MRPRRSADAARAAIEATALELFTQKGYEATSLDEVAKALGITRQAVLYHYGSKEHLLAAVITPAMDDVQATLAELDPADPPTRDQQRETLAALVHSMAAYRPAHALLSGLHTGTVALQAAPHLIETNQRVAHLLGGSDVDRCPRTRVRVLATMAALKGSMASRLSLPLETDEELDTLIDASLAMLAS